MKTINLNNLKLELSLKAKNGIDFIFSAGIIWIAITIIWMLSYTSYNKSIFTFMIGGILLPLAFLLSKILKTQWKVKHNPLQPLGLWLNFAQLFYFPFLIFILIANPDYFVMTYAIITGAHLFPYAWFYNQKSYAVFAGLISVGSMLISINIDKENMFYVPLYTSTCLILLGVCLFIFYKRKSKLSLK